MGKCIKRNLNRFDKEPPLKRDDALKTVFSAVKNRKTDEETVRLTAIFGIDAEELTEMGAVYEDIVIFKKYCKLL